MQISMLQNSCSGEFRQGWTSWSATGIINMRPVDGKDKFYTVSHDVSQYAFEFRPMVTSETRVDLQHNQRHHTAVESKYVLGMPQ